MKEFRRSSGTKFYCFSPPIMAITFAIEIALVIYVLARYKMSVATRLATAILACLAVFQLAEYSVCGQAAGADAWSRIGFIAIALLPALGMHLLQVISGRGWAGIKWLAYGSAAAWVVTLGLAGQAFNPHVCGGNYIIFHLTGNLGGIFYIYYYFWLSLTILLAAYFAKAADRHKQRALQLLVLGYCLFFVPTIILNRLKPETSAGIPSIMCGFAVIYAFILVFAILPRLKVQLRKRK